MKVVEMNNAVLQKLQESGLLKKMKSLEDCKFLVIEEEKEKIIGASGIGGILHVHSIQLLEEAQGLGLGWKLFDENIKEAKRRRYSFVTASRDPENKKIAKIHNDLGFKTCFRVHYSKDIISDSLILTINKKGIIVLKIFKIFNTRFGNFCLGIILKIAKPFFRKFLTYTPNKFSEQELLHMIKNFEKI